MNVTNLHSTRSTKWPYHNLRMNKSMLLLIEVLMSSAMIQWQIWTKVSPSLHKWVTCFVSEEIFPDTEISQCKSDFIQNQSYPWRFRKLTDIARTLRKFVETMWGDVLLAAVVSDKTFDVTKDVSYGQLSRYLPLFTTQFKMKTSWCYSSTCI